MKISLKKNAQNEAEVFSRLLQLIKDDPQIRSYLVQVLALDSYRRRIVLNRWLEKLRRENAPEKLRQALSYLLDDMIVKKVLKLIDSLCI